MKMKTLFMLVLVVALGLSATSDGFAAIYCSVS